MNSEQKHTTETQRTQRLHREISEPGLLRQAAMTPERWQQIKAVLEEALERDPHERESFLDEACGGDSELRVEVEALIDSHARSGDFIESPANKVLADIKIGRAQYRT